MAQGSTIAKHRQAGYQEALSDIANRYVETRLTDGAIPALNAVLEWIENNTNDSGIREAIADAIENGPKNY